MLTYDLVELEKQKLEDHYNRYKQTNEQYKRLQLVYLWEFIQKSPFFSPICKAIREKAFPRFDQQRYWIVWNQQANPLYGEEEDRIGLSYLIIEDISTGNHDSTIIYRIGKKYTGNTEGSSQDHFNLFNELFLDPLKVYLIQKLKRSAAITELLKKYKHRTSWYTKNSLYQLAINDPSRAERHLMTDLCGYLYDNGIVAYAEPLSPSGRIDYVGTASGNPVKILIEGKIFDGDSRDKAHLIKGFEQLRHYSKEYNEPCAYLFVFNLSPRHLVFETRETRDGFPVLPVDNRIIYLVVVDIFNHDQPASKRPKEVTIEIRREELIKAPV
ncbi:MAG: hypothetical protein GXC78_13095 [Chitinophagaceae bacterium]|nr:hypothetical protein [Chitinophagaceae bacterium]